MGKVNKKLIIGTALGACGGIIGGYFIGKNFVPKNVIKGTAHDFMEQMIQLEESGNEPCLVVKSTNPKLGNLMYQIWVEQIGD